MRSVSDDRAAGLPEDAPLVLKALALAAAAHHGVLDKGGKPYIGHPLRVVLHLGPDVADEVLAAAALHDTVEDTPLTLDDLRKAGFPERTVALVDAVTRRKGRLRRDDRDESYQEFIHRILDHPDRMALAVKLADLADNTHPSRALRDPHLRSKYREAVAEVQTRLGSTAPGLLGTLLVRVAGHLAGGIP